MDRLEYSVRRKRGRPAGKGVPLSREERKARNAQYEKERRMEIAEATSELTKIVGCENSVTLPNLLNCVLHLINKNANKDPSESEQALKQKNEEIRQEIAELELEQLLLGNQENCNGDSDSETHTPRNNKKKRNTKGLLDNGTQQSFDDTDFNINMESNRETEQLDLWNCTLLI